MSDILTVAFSELSTYLGSLEANTKETAYRLSITGLMITDLGNSQTSGTLGYILKSNPTKYVDLTPTTFPEGITDARFMFSDCKSLTSIDTLNFTSVTDASGMFEDCTSLLEINTSGLLNVTDASDLFLNCSNLLSVDTSPFTKVTNAEAMFKYCDSITSIDTSVFTEVTNAKEMFYHCFGLTDINTEAFSKVIDASYMFYSCVNLTNINLVPFSSVTNADYMLFNCTSLTDINTVSLTKATSAEGMLCNCTGLTTVDTSGLINVTDAKYLMQGCTSLTYVDIIGLESITDATSMFNGCTNLQTIDSFNLDTTTVDMSNCFADCDSLVAINVISPFTEAESFTFWKLNATEVDSQNGFNYEIRSLSNDIIASGFVAVSNEQSIDIENISELVFLPTGTLTDEFTTKIIQYRCPMSTTGLDLNIDNFVLWVKEGSNVISNVFATKTDVANSVLESANTLLGNIDDEATARNQGDSDLQTQIDNIQAGSVVVNEATGSGTVVTSVTATDGSINVEKGITPITNVTQSGSGTLVTGMYVSGSNIVFSKGVSFSVSGTTLTISGI